MENKKLEKAILSQFRGNKLNDDVCYLVGAVTVFIGEGRKKVDLNTAFNRYVGMLPNGVSVYSKLKFREMVAFLSPDAMREFRDEILVDLPRLPMTNCITHLDLGGWCDLRMYQLITQSKAVVDELAES